MGLDAFQQYETATALDHHLNFMVKKFADKPQWHPKIRFDG